MNSSITVLAGDIGGTNTRLSLWASGGDGVPVLLSEARYSSDPEGRLGDVVKSFLATFAGSEVQPASACLGVPGPVVKGVVRTTNLPWVLTEKELADETGIPTVRLVNDLVATASALPFVTAQDTLSPYGDGPVRGELSVVVAPGTGLGRAAVVKIQGGWHPLPSEGGHVDFAPRTPLEDRLLGSLREKFGRVSRERVLSGPGIGSIFRFLVEVEGRVPVVTVRSGEEEELPAVVGNAAVRGECPVCEEAVGQFFEILGSVCGDEALMFLPSGGIFIGGGVVSKLSPLVQSGSMRDRFRAGYLSKGRLSSVVERVPVDILLDEGTALRGAAAVAPSVAAANHSEITKR